MESWKMKLPGEDRGVEQYVQGPWGEGSEGLQSECRGEGGEQGQVRLSLDLEPNWAIKRQHLYKVMQDLPR